MITIVDQFIPELEQDRLEAYVTDSKFPYRFHEIHSYHDECYMGYSPKQLTHHLMMHREENVSPHFPIITPVFGSLMKMFGEITLFRAKVNCTFPDPRVDPLVSQQPHVDLKYEDGRIIPHLVCLYYINDSDGPTFFYDKDFNIIEMVNPQKGSAVIFDGQIMHSGTNPYENPFRFALNINFRQGADQIP
jgi:hypothetical protein